MGCAAFRNGDYSSLLPACVWSLHKVGEAVSASPVSCLLPPASFVAHACRTLHLYPRHTALRAGCRLDSRFARGGRCVCRRVAPPGRAGRQEEGLAARGKSSAAFDRRRIPAACVAPRSHAAGMFPRRALPDGRITCLGATLDFHHGLLAEARRTPTLAPEAEPEGEALGETRLGDSLLREIDPIRDPPDFDPLFSGIVGRVGGPGGRCHAAVRSNPG